MPTWVHRTTKELLVSVPISELPDIVSNYIIFPDLSNVRGVPSIYWIITGDDVTEMSAAEKAVVDQVITDAKRDGVISRVDNIEDLFRAFAIIVKDEINILRAQHGLPPRTLGQLRTAIRNSLGS